MHGTPRALYYGPDADVVAADWGERQYQLEVETLTPDADADPSAVFADGTYDGVVCRATASCDVTSLVDAVGDSDRDIPLVVFAGDDGLDVSTAMAKGVTGYYDVDGSFDPVEALETLIPTIEQRREARYERTMLDSLLSKIPISVYFKDEQSRHVRVSDAMVNLADPYYHENPEGKRHVAAEDVVGKSEFDLYAGPDAERAVADDERVMETGEPIDNPPVRVAGGPLDGIYVSTIKAPWYDETGELLGTFGMTTNVSERERYRRRLERQNDRLERFASAVSHDLRNPLEVAMGRLPLARESGDPEHFDAIERSLERMNELIDEVLVLARQGKTVDDPEPTRLGTVAEETWTTVDTADATLAVRTDATIFADPSRLRELLGNLFRNAVEHAGEDATVTISDVETDDGWQGFAVTDDGPGIPTDEREDVFESGYSTVTGGTGLGLSIVRTIAEAHGWTVTATNGETGGARFEFDNVQRSDP